MQSMKEVKFPHFLPFFCIIIVDHTFTGHPSPPTFRGAPVTADLAAVLSPDSPSPFSLHLFKIKAGTRQCQRGAGLPDTVIQCISVPVPPVPPVPV